jgi:hypothetical protein
VQNRERGTSEERKKIGSERKGQSLNIESILHFWRLYVTPKKHFEIYLF